MIGADNEAAEEPLYYEAVAKHVVGMALISAGRFVRGRTKAGNVKVTIRPNYGSTCASVSALSIAATNELSETLV
jgi:hypothetical protein